MECYERNVAESSRLNVWEDKRTTKASWNIVMEQSVSKVMNKGKTAGLLRILTEVIMTNENFWVKWLTVLCNLIVAEWKYSGDLEV